MKPKYPCPFNPEYLQKCSTEHLWYEIWMFFRTGTVLLAGVSSPRVEFVENAILESFAIHFRNLLDFFYPLDKPRPDDIIAAYYFDGGDLPTDFPQKSTLLTDSEIRAHKQVSHLTTMRLAGDHPNKGWYSVPLMEEIMKVLLAFIETASPDRLGPQFLERIRALLGKPNNSAANLS